MASEAIISLVVDYLIPYAQEKVTLVSSAREEVGKLAGTLKLIQKVLADAQQKQVTDAAVMTWLVKLKDVVYAAEDVLDEWQTRDALSKLQTGDVYSASSARKKVLSILLPICHCFKDVSVRYGVGVQIKEIRKRLDAIAEEKAKYAFVASDSRNDLHPFITPLATSSVNELDIHGRDNDKNIIKNLLLSDSSTSVLIHVISIIGMGGIGKTTLARLVFKEKVVENAFDYKIWVCVSQSFDQTRIAKEFIEQATKNPPPSFNGLEALLQHLSELVKGKRFLLILDNVWTDDHRDWEPLNGSLRDGASGSRIVVTTRSREVAMLMGSTHIHDLKVLSKEDSWSLLSHIALRRREQDCQKFKNIGREIAFKCKGVPLAIQTLASHLRSKKLIKEWIDVANNSLWDMPKIKEFFLPSLFISYYSLPPISKQCFLFCSVFPKDTTMHKSHLVELWMANGFFGYQGNKELEKIGEGHFDILAMRSFFQDFVRDSDEAIVCCQMHDLVHDFAQFLSQGECFVDDDNGSERDASKVRHLWTEKFDNAVYDVKNLRTLMGLGLNVVSHLDKLVYLRTLDLSGCGFEELPSGVFGLLHLRYLDLSFNYRLTELPEEICELYNLQTLKLHDCLELCKLPDRIGDLSNLRHLDIGLTRIDGLPLGFKKLIFVRTLSYFVVGALDTECKIGDLKHLNKLQGKLVTRGLGRIKDANEAADAELNKKNDIDSLLLDFSSEESCTVLIHIRHISVLEKLEPPKYLKVLQIDDYLGDRFPGWMPQLRHVVELTLSGCVNFTQLPLLGKLELLEKLKLYSLGSVKRLGPEFFGGEDGGVSFPELKSLEICDMNELEEWNIPPFLQGDVVSTTRRRIMPNLRELDIRNCPKLTNLPFTPNQEIPEKPLPLHNQFAHPLNSLRLYECDSLDFDLKDLQQFITLQYLDIKQCPHLAKRFQSEEWRSILSHVPTIRLDDAWIKSK